MSQYNIIAESAEYTVVSAYERTESTTDAYQSEAELERENVLRAEIDRIIAELQ